MERRRFSGPDTLRGLTLASMAAYHACWDMVHLFGADWAWYGSFAAYAWQQSICWTFLLLSGYCWSLGRRPVRRGLIVFASGALVSAVTLAMPEEDRIFWGVLSLLGASMGLTALLERALRRVPARAGLAGSFLLFLLLRDAGRGFLGFEGFRLAALPPGLYRSLGTACLGFPPPGFHSTDYFPLVPWYFLFLTGYFLYRLRPGGPGNIRLPVFTALGRRSLAVYLLHQPVIYGLLRALRLLGGA